MFVEVKQNQPSPHPQQRSPCTFEQPPVFLWWIFTRQIISDLISYLQRNPRSISDEQVIGKSATEEMVAVILRSDMNSPALSKTAENTLPTGGNGASKCRDDG